MVRLVALSGLGYSATSLVIMDLQSVLVFFEYYVTGSHARFGPSIQIERSG